MAKRLTIRPPRSVVQPFARIGISTVGVGTGISKGSTKKLTDSFVTKYTKRLRQLKKNQQEQQRLSIFESVQKLQNEHTLVSGSIATLRDDDGNIILYADSSNPSKNIERQDQFVSVELYSDIYDIDAAADVIDFSVFELKSIDNKNDLIDNFIRTFRAILPDIPNEDLQFIIRKGVEEQGGEIISPVEFDRLTNGSFSSIIQRMIDLQDASEETQQSISSLESQVATLTTQLEAMGELVIETSTNDAGLDLVTLIRRVTARLRQNKLIEGDIEVSADGEPTKITIRAYKYMGTNLGEDLSNFSNIDEIQVDVTFLTLLGESSTMRASLPVELIVPPVTTINGFREEVTGVKIRLVNTGDFKGWFKNNLKISSATEYVSGVLTPGELIQLKVAYDIHTEPNSGIPRYPDTNDDIDDILAHKLGITIPDGDGRSPNMEDIIIAPPGDINDRIISSEISNEKRKRKREEKAGGDPDIPKLPLEDNEIAIEQLPTEVVENVVPPERPSETIGIEETDDIKDIQPDTPAVVNITPPLRKQIIVIPPPPPPLPELNHQVSSRKSGNTRN